MRAPGRPGSPGLVLALLVAVGIGLHNFGEGLAIGAAFALGEAALGTLLVIGFTLHNTTEGLAIVAPMAKERPRSARWRVSGSSAARRRLRARGLAAWSIRRCWRVAVPRLRRRCDRAGHRADRATDGGRRQRRRTICVGAGVSRADGRFRCDVRDRLAGGLIRITTVMVGDRWGC